MKEITRLTQAQFYKVCNEVAAQFEVFSSKRLTRLEVAKTLSEKLGFPIPEVSIERAQKATSCTWKTNRISTKRIKSTNTNPKFRILARSVATLYVQLGGKVPADLQDLLTTLEGRPTAKWSDASNSSNENNHQ